MLSSCRYRSLIFSCRLKNLLLPDWQTDEGGLLLLLEEAAPAPARADCDDEVAVETDAAGIAELRLEELLSLLLLLDFWRLLGDDVGDARTW